MDKQTIRLADRHTNRNSTGMPLMGRKLNRFDILMQKWGCYAPGQVKRGRCISEDHQQEEGLKKVCTQMCVFAHALVHKRMCVCMCMCVCLKLFWPLLRYQIKVVNMLLKHGAKRLKIRMAKDLHISRTCTQRHTHKQDNNRDICSTVLSYSQHNVLKAHSNM